MANYGTSPKRCILYYPTISIPSGRWLKKTILYWDEIGSIVPIRYDEKELVPYTPIVQKLRDEDLFRPFRPETFVNQGWEGVGQFEQEFKSILCSKPYQDLLTRQKFFQPLLNLLTFSPIHRDKVSENLFYYLEQKGLAQQKSPSGEISSDWIYFERDTALLYMGVLAKYLADNDISYTIPGTDISRYENMIFQSSSPNEGVGCLRTSFRNSLPIPRDDVPIEKIIKFKRKRHNELLHFRQELDEFQRNLRQCKEKAEITEVTTTFKEKLEQNVQDLEALMNDSKISIIAGSVKTLIKIDSPTLWATIGVAANQATKIADLPLQWSAIGVGILGTIEIAAYLVDQCNEQRATLRNSPFAYLYHAKREGILAKPKTH